MTASVVFLPAADQDIDQISNIWARKQDCPSVRAIWTNLSDWRLTLHSSHLPARHGASWVMTSGTGSSAPYLVIYRHSGDDLVLVLRVVHGSQNITRRLLRSIKQEEQE